MAQEKKLVTAITSRDEDFAQWYTDIVKKAELCDYSSMKGCVILRPYAQAIWENIQKIFDGMIKECGHENVAMPIFIPESLLQREKDHVEGFAPEVAWVTHGGSEKLEERLCVRPTSETLFCEHFSHIVHSWRDLPKLYNQWCSVVRWEKSTRPFLRTREFWWQEGHTVHETEQEAREETLRILDFYAELAEKYLCMPVIKGRKTDREKFAGAMETYTIEAMMHDGKALQSGTSHYFGDGFAKAFDITFANREGGTSYAHETSWGISTRLIGGIIMTHGDDSGLVLPPAIAPIQVVIIPVAAHKPGVTEKAMEVADVLKKAGIRVKVDTTDNTVGWKYAEYEMKGVPVRLEIGPRDIENNACVLVRRDNREKTVVSLDNLIDSIKTMLDDFAKAIFEKAKANMEANTVSATTLEEMKQDISEKPRFVKAMWCGDEACEEKVKEVTGMPSRCIPFEQEHISDVCPVCGKPAKYMVVYGIAY